MKDELQRGEIQFFDTLAEADEANAEFYRSLTPEQRLDIALELMRPFYEAHPRFERVYRFADVGECPVSGDWGVGVQPVR